MKIWYLITKIKLLLYKKVIIIKEINFFFQKKNKRNTQKIKYEESDIKRRKILVNFYETFKNWHFTIDNYSILKSNIKSSLTINYFLIWILHLKTLNRKLSPNKKKSNDSIKNSKINKNLKQDKQAEGLAKIFKGEILFVVVVRSIFLTLLCTHT